MHSSTSIAIRLRKSIVVGFISTSPSEITGNSSGNPPALQTPRLTASATWRRWALQLLSSDQEFAMPTTGRPSKTRSLKPSALSHARWAKPSRSRRPNQLRLLSGCAVIVPSGATIIEEVARPKQDGAGSHLSRATHGGGGGTEVARPKQDGAGSHLSRATHGGGGGTEVARPKQDGAGSHLSRATHGGGGLTDPATKEIAHATERQGGGGDGRGQRHRARHRAGDGARGRRRLDPGHPR